MAKANRELKVLLNIGRDHQKQYGIPLAKEDEVVTVNEEQANIMVNKLKVAKDYNAEEEAEHRARVEEFDNAVIETEVAMLQHRMDIEAQAKQRVADVKARVAGRPTASRAVRSQAVAEEESPVDSDTADEAKDKISRMRDKDKLQSIAANEKRPTVADAAKKRLAELG